MIQLPSFGSIDGFSPISMVFIHHEDYVNLGNVFLYIDRCQGYWSTWWMATFQLLQEINQHDEWQLSNYFLPPSPTNPHDCLAWLAGVQWTLARESILVPVVALMIIIKASDCKMWHMCFIFGHGLLGHFVMVQPRH